MSRDRSATSLQANIGQPSATNREFPVRKLVLFFVALATTFDYRFLAGMPGLPSFTLMELITLWAFFLLFVDNIIYSGALWSQVVRIWRANPYLVGYFGWIALLAFVNFFRGYGLATMAQFKDLLPSIVLVLVLIAYGRSADSLTLVVKALLVGIALNLVIGVSQGLTGWPRFVELNVGSAGKVDLDGRIVGGLMATGWFAHPNGFAMFLIPPVALLTTLISGRLAIGTFWRIAAVVCTPLLVFALYRTQGKGAMAWSIVAFAYAVYPTRARFGAWWIMACGTVSGILAITAFGVFESHQMRSLSTILTRIELWEAAVEALRSDVGFLLFGAAFEKVFYLSIVTTGFKFPYPNAHNAFLNQAVFYGLPGLILYLLAIGRATRSLCVSRQENSLGTKFRGSVTYALAGTFALLGEYFFEPAAEGVLNQAQLFLLLGLCAVLIHPPAKFPDMRSRMNSTFSRRQSRLVTAMPICR